MHLDHVVNKIIMNKFLSAAIIWSTVMMLMFCTPTNKYSQSSVGKIDSTKGLKDYFSNFSKTEQEQFFGGNAIRFYSL